MLRRMLAAVMVLATILGVSSGVRAQAVAEVRAVADEIATDAAYADETALGPDDSERERFRQFAKRHLSADV